MTYIAFFPHNSWGSSPKLFFLPQNLFLNPISSCGFIASFLLVLRPPRGVERRAEKSSDRFILWLLWAWLLPFIAGSGNPQRGPAHW